jgi:hypothetical protein
MPSSGVTFEYVLTEARWGNIEVGLAQPTVGSLQPLPPHLEALGEWAAKTLAKYE